MPQPRQCDFIAGARRRVATTGVPLADPNTGAPLGHAAQSTPDAVEHACRSSTGAMQAWADSAVDTRLQFLAAFAERLDERSDDIAHAEALDTGIPITTTLLFAAALPDVARRAGELLTRAVSDRDLSVDGRPIHLLRRPRGPAAVIAPFNAPAFTIVKKGAYAIAAGCPVIVKASPVAAHSASLVADAAFEAVSQTGAPDALLQLVHGDASVAVQLAGSSHVQCVSFTGSRAGGAAITVAASSHLPALQLECGSNNPAIVRADANIAETARQLVAGFTKLNGQWCERPGTAFVHAEALAPLLASLTEQLAALRIGDSRDPATHFGPQANAAQMRNVVDAIERLTAQGATAHQATEPPERGFFVMPTLLTGAPPDASTDEIFGPVLVLHPVADDTQALSLANNCAGGLAGYVFSRDIPAAIRLGGRIQAGEVKINGTSVLDMHPSSRQSFWTGSGIGGHGDEDLLQFFTGTRIVGVDIADPLL